MSSQTVWVVVRSGWNGNKIVVSVHRTEESAHRMIDELYRTETDDWVTFSCHETSMEED